MIGEINNTQSKKYTRKQIDVRYHSLVQESEDNFNLQIRGANDKLTQLNADVNRRLLEEKTKLEKEIIKLQERKKELDRFASEKITEYRTKCDEFKQTIKNQRDQSLAKYKKDYEFTLKQNGYLLEKPIGTELKKKCWDRWIGKFAFQSKCLCCDKNNIDNNNFEVCYVVSEKNGGKKKYTKFKTCL